MDILHPNTMPKEEEVYLFPQEKAVPRAHSRTAMRCSLLSWQSPGAANILSHVSFLRQTKLLAVLPQIPQRFLIPSRKSLGGARSQGTLDQTSLREINFSNIQRKHFPSLSDFTVSTLNKINKSRGNQGTVVLDLSCVFYA